MTTKTKAPRTETEKLFALDKPSLENLSYALRHPETWPKDFNWYYEDCESCAMGLAHVLWSEVFGKDITEADITDVARTFAMPYTVARDIFFAACPAYPQIETKTGMLWWKTVTRETDCDGVTPDMVADQIDKHLASVR